MLARLASWCLGIVIGFDDLTPPPPTVEVEGVYSIPSAPVQGKRGSKEVAQGQCQHNDLTAKAQERTGLRLQGLSWGGFSLVFLFISVSSLPISDTNIISWNCRGNKRKLVLDFLQYSIRSNRVCMVLLQETHSDETVIRRVARRLGRSWCFTEFPSAGASGGIALLWNASFVKTQVLSIHSHYFNAAVRFMNSHPWILTGVYA